MAQQANLDRRCQVIMLLTETNQTDPPCRFHISLLFTMGRSPATMYDRDAWIFEVVKRGSAHEFRATAGLSMPLPFRTLHAVDLGRVALVITGPQLRELLSDVPIATPLADPSTYSCWQWANDALFKLNLRGVIAHEQWVLARAEMKRIADRTGRPRLAIVGG